MKTALLPIRPYFADAIFSGEKLVEFRRKEFKHEISNVVVYSCSPVMRIIGYFEVEEVYVSTPQNAWDRFGNLGCISEKDFLNYFKGSDKAVSIRIKKAIRFKTPIHIQELNEHYVAPQSFRYLSSKIFSKIQKIVTI